MPLNEKGEWEPDAKAIYIASVLLFLVIGCFNGLVDHLETTRRGKTGCDYYSLWDYVPGRVVACEILRHRFKPPSSK
jgi:hypothetical protein